MPTIAWVRPWTASGIESAAVIRAVISFRVATISTRCGWVSASTATSSPVDVEEDVPGPSASARNCCGMCVMARSGGPAKPGIAGGHYGKPDHDGENGDQGYDNRAAPQQHDRDDEQHEPDHQQTNHGPQRCKQAT